MNLMWYELVRMRFRRITLRIKIIAGRTITDMIEMSVKAEFERLHNS